MGGYATSSIDAIPAHEQDCPVDAAWKPVRHHFGITAFGVNAWVAASEGEIVVEEHDEAPPSGAAGGHEELYVVVRGGARFTVDGESFDAPAGTIVALTDPALVRSATALEAGTTVLAVGASPATAFTVSPWERRNLGE